MASRKQYDKAAELGKHIEAKEAELKKLVEEWERERASGSAEVKAEHVAQIVSRLTGIPVNELTVEEREKLLHLEQRLHGAWWARTKLCARWPMPCGCRARACAKAASQWPPSCSSGRRVWARPNSPRRWPSPSMAMKVRCCASTCQYGERHTVARLVGAPPGYVGYDEGGQLTEKVRRKPYSVLLLDEIEKAHPDVYNILLQVFDDGRLTDGKGRVVDFTNTIIIATSNLGSDIIQRRLKARGAPARNTRRPSPR